MQNNWPKRRVLALIGMMIWAGMSVFSAIEGWAEIFAAMGAFALSVGAGIFLTDRYLVSEERRYWDSLVETQARQTWRFIKQLRAGTKGEEPHDLDEMARQIDDSFETLLETKAREVTLENYRLEMIFSMTGTLQWGFGALLVAYLHG